ncbi:MAG: hydrolase 1, exosortase A system-associated, partial [Pseudomonadota bacterium]
MSSISPVVISCHNDNMVGILHGSDVDANVGIVIIVGGPQYRVGSHRQFVLLARDFANVGFPVLRFDFRGMGDSSGAFREFEAVGDDIRAAIDCFYEQHRSLRHVVLFGLCDAASASLMYAHEDPRVLGLVLVNPWARTDAGEARAFLRHYYFSRFLQKSFWRKVFSGEFRIGDSFRDLARKVVRAGDSVGARNTTDESFLVRMRTGVENFTGKILLI